MAEVEIPTNPEHLTPKAAALARIDKELGLTPSRTMFSADEVADLLLDLRNYVEKT